MAITMEELASPRRAGPSSLYFVWAVDQREAELRKWLFVEELTVFDCTYRYPYCLKHCVSV